MPLIESFTVDHTKMNAPQVRKAKEIKGPDKGELVTVFDLRFIKPNTKVMDTSAVHTLEHFLATYMREKIEGIIDVSPMGCRTGFYMSIFGDHTVEEIQTVLEYALERIIAFEGKVPGAKEKECGNYQDHSLTKAKENAKKVLEGLKK
ncbi:MAG: S-ribosylhomocysteine lyase [Fusobacteriota bacterium]